MSRTAIHRAPLSVEEYLRREERSPVRHEYVRGSIFAMTGATKRHNRIAGNIHARLWTLAGDRPCRVYVSDVKLRAAEEVIYYPDVMVACGPDDADPVIEEAPCLVVEVLSPRTRETDRREKLSAYKQIPSVQGYLIVHQARRRVEHHFRDGEGSWWYLDLVEEGSLALSCPRCKLTLDEIYKGVLPREKSERS